MKKLLLHLGDVKDIKKMKLRHLLQSLLVFSCFCTLDTISANIINNHYIYLAGAFFAVVGIGLSMILAGRIKLNYYSNILNLLACGAIIGCHFTPYMLPFAIFLVVILASIRISLARRKLNDYCFTIVIVGTVFISIIARFALMQLPLWVLGLLMLLTLFNPEIEKDLDKETKKANLSVIIAAVLLIIFFITIEIFGGPLTDAVTDNFPMQLVNFAYLFGYSFFILSALFFRAKSVSVFVMMIALAGLFFFLLPPLSTVGIYALLFVGGGIKVLMLIFPVTVYKGKWKYYGAFGGVFIYRLAFLASGISEALAQDNWSVDSNFTYVLAAINIILAVGLIFLLGNWDRQEVKALTEKRVKEIYDAPIILPDYLSIREQEVGRLILSGYSAEEIAEKLFIANSTARTHIKSILKKTECTTQRMFIVKFSAKNNN